MKYKRKAFDWKFKHFLMVTILFFFVCWQLQQSPGHQPSATLPRQPGPRAPPCAPPRAQQTAAVRTPSEDEGCGTTPPSLRRPWVFPQRTQEVQQVGAWCGYLGMKESYLPLWEAADTTLLCPGDDTVNVEAGPKWKLAFSVGKAIYSVNSQVIFMNFCNPYFLVIP